jgi:hypothetical protein
VCAFYSPEVGILSAIAMFQQLIKNWSILIALFDIRKARPDAR